MARKYYTPLQSHKDFHYKKLMRFLRNRYGYEFLSEDDRKKYESILPFRYLEKLVATYGRGAVYKDENDNFGIYTPVMAGNLTIYGNPGTYFLYTANGRQHHKVQADDKNLVILQDNYDGEAFQYIADYYAHLLGKTRETSITNVNAMKLPYIVQATKEKLIAVRMALEAVNEMPEVVEDPTIKELENIKVLDLKTPDNLKSLEDYWNTIFSKFKEDVGFSSQNVDKKERLVAAEAEDDQDTLKAFDNEPYEHRKMFVKAMEEKFSIKLKLVKANDDLYVEPKQPKEEK